MVNQATLDLLGYAEGELIRRPFEAVCAEGFFKGARDRDTFQAARVDNAETTYLTREGRAIPVSLSASLMHDAEGAFQGIVCVARDITERKRAEEALRKAREELEIRVQERTADLVEANTALQTEITDRKRAEEALRRLNEGLEQEAERIAQSLHDEAGQLLAAAHLTLAMAAPELPPPARERLREARKQFAQIEEQWQRLTREVRPRILDDLGLLPALEFLAEGVRKRMGIPVNVAADLERRLPALVETAMYRLAQESLTNVMKHDHATQVSIQLTQVPGGIRCLIRDDGIGFDAPGVLARRGERGLGLIGIRDRLEALGGRVEISSVPGRGTELVVTVPLEV